MRFQNTRAQALYFSRVADDVCGSPYGVGWAGLYLCENGGAWVLEYWMQEQYVSVRLLEEEELDIFWNMLCERFELSGDPDPGNDIVIEEDQGGKYIVTPGDGWYETRWLALHQIVEDYGDDLPRIWFRNRRNVFTLVPEEELETFLRDL